MANRLNMNSDIEQQQQHQEEQVDEFDDTDINDPVHYIKITVNSAIIQNNGNALPNPYAEIDIVNNFNLKYATTVKSATVYPNWCESFMVPIIASRPLIISVWDFTENTIHNHIIGECHINVQDLLSVVRDDCDTINITRELILTQNNGVTLRNGQISLEITGLNGLKTPNYINENIIQDNNNNNNSNNGNGNGNDNNRGSRTSSNSSSNSSSNEHCRCPHHRIVHNADEDETISDSSEGIIGEGIVSPPSPQPHYYSFTNKFTGKAYRWSVIYKRHDLLITPKEPYNANEHKSVKVKILNLLIWLSDFEEMGILTATLPSGWIRSIDPTQRIKYFELENKKAKIYCSSNGKQSIASIFIHGCDKNKILVLGIPSAIHYITSANTNFLPMHWQSYKIHPSDIEFFCNHHNHVTQWNIPGAIDTLTIEIPYNANMTNQQMECIKNDFKFKFRFNQFKYLCFINKIDGNQYSILVDRDGIFKSSYDSLMRIRGYHLRNDIAIEFVGENGVDSGGITREWYLYLTRECLNPDYGLFEYTKDYRLQINPNSHLVYNNYIYYFRFIGRIIAMALYNNQLIYTNFCHVFYKSLLNQQLTMDDLELHDPQLYNSLLWVFERDLDGNGEPEFWFTVDQIAFGQVKTHELLPNGKHIRVTNENKEEYTRLMMYWKLSQSIEIQMKSIKLGFNDVIPIEWLLGFDAFQLDVMLCGMQEIDVNDWKRCTRYREIDSNSPLIKWFWHYIESCDNIKRGKILQFITGTHRPPFGQFSNLVNKSSGNPFTIRYSGGHSSELPVACTCANRIEIPEYQSYKQLVEKFNFAIEETVGFGNV